MNQVLPQSSNRKRAPYIAPIVALSLLTGASLVIPLALPMSAAPKAMLKRSAAALGLASVPFFPTQAPGSVSMLVAGGAMMVFGLVGRKRRAEKVSERR